MLSTAGALQTSVYFLHASMLICMAIFSYWRHVCDTVMEAQAVQHRGGLCHASFSPSVQRAGHCSDLPRRFKRESHRRIDVPAHYVGCEYALPYSGAGIRQVGQAGVLPCQRVSHFATLRTLYGILLRAHPGWHRLYCTHS